MDLEELMTFIKRGSSSREAAEKLREGDLPNTVSPEQVIKHIRVYWEHIFQDWSLLNAVLDRHEAAIRKRWAKKTRSMRKDVLLYCWPNMAPSHRPDIVASRKESARQKGTSEYQDSYIYPYINQEDLLKPNMLP